MSADTYVTRSFECVLYTATSIGSTPTWAAVPGVMNVTLTVTMKESDTSTRGMGGFSTNEPTLADVSVEFNMPYVRGDTTRTQFVTALFARTALGIAVMDELIATSGATGIWADMKVFSGPREEALDKTVDQKFVLKPCYSVNQPLWKTIS